MFIVFSPQYYFNLQIFNLNKGFYLDDQLVGDSRDQLVEADGRLRGVDLLSKSEKVKMNENLKLNLNRLKSFS